MDMNVNVKTCIFRNKVEPVLVKQLSSEPCVWMNKRKLIMAHKMYGIPYYDKTGQYGISNRDNYILHIGSSSSHPDQYHEDTNPYAKHLQYLFYMWYLSTPLARCYFMSTIYRMRYLEKYAFQLMKDLWEVSNIRDYWYNNIHKRFLKEKNEVSNSPTTQSTQSTQEIIHILLLHFSRYILQEWLQFDENEKQEKEYIDTILNIDSYPYHTFINDAYDAYEAYEE
jgi:hypothetical protein